MPPSAEGLQYVCTVFSAFAFTVEPVMDAVAAENRGIEWRDSLSTT